MYSFYDKNVMWSLPLYAERLFQKLCVGSPHIRMTVMFYGQKPYRHGIMFYRVTANFFTDFRLSIARTIPH